MLKLALYLCVSVSLWLNFDCKLLFIHPTSRYISQYNMRKFNVSLEKEKQLLARMQELGIKEGDLLEKFIRGSGKGGQKINKTSSCVYLLHRPTGTEVKCQASRSRSLNRFLARRELCDKIEGKIKGVHSQRLREQAKIRRQKKRRSRRLKERILRDKRRRSETTAQRKNIKTSDDHG